MSKHAKAMTASIVMRIGTKCNISGDHPSYTCVYKTVRRTCAEQWETIEVERALTSVSFTLQQLTSLKELVLVFSETLEDEVWVKYYQIPEDMIMQDMTMQENPYLKNPLGYTALLAW